MTTLFSSTVPLVGAAPWSVGAFTLEAHKSISITAFGLGADDLICIQQVRNVQAGNANLTLEACGVNMPDDEVIAQSQQLLDCGIKVCICAKQPWVRLDSGRFPPGDYRLSVIGTNVSNGTVVVEAEVGESFGANSCAYCAACEVVAPPAPPPPPATANITPCPAVFPLVWSADGQTYASLMQFKTSLDSLLGVATTYAAATCTFTAPAGTVFPSLLFSAAPIPPVVYCPSMPLPDGGFGYHIADPKDPLATVEIAPCAGDTSTDSIWVYSSASPGNTAKVTSCDGATIGYGANQSKCAISCPCPDMTVTVNNTAPIVNVASPVNNFSPTNNVASAVNNFNPTTNVAAPNVTLPAPNIVAAGYDANGKLTITKSDGSIVQTSDLPAC